MYPTIPVYETGPPPTAGQHGVPLPPGQTPGTVIYIAAPPQPHLYASSAIVYANYPSKQSRNLGAVMIVVGILSVCFHILPPIFIGTFHQIGYEVLDGLWDILSGAFGIAAAKRKTNCLIVTFMVFCIITAVSCTLFLVVGSMKLIYLAGVGFTCQNMLFEGNNTDELFYTDIVVTMKVLLSITIVILTVASFWGSIICCKATGCSCCCCNQMGRPGQVLAATEIIPMQGAQQVVMYTPQQQQQQYQVGHPDQQGDTYPAQIYPGYPSQMLMNTTIGASGYDPRGGARDMHAPPSYDETKRAL